MFFNPIRLHDLGSSSYIAYQNNYHSDPDNSQTALQTMLKIEQYLFENRQSLEMGPGDLYAYACDIELKHAKANSPCLYQISTIRKRVVIISQIHRFSTQHRADFEFRVNKLLELGVRIETENESFLRMALERKCFNLAQTLLTKGANPNFMSQGNHAITMLCHAFDNIQMIHALIQAGADVNQLDFKGQTPLISACKRDKIEVMRILLSKGANVDYVGRRGSALQIAIRALNERAVVLLAEAQANVDEGAAREIVKIATNRETVKTIHFIQVLLRNGFVNSCLKDVAEANGNLGTFRVLTTSTGIP